MPPTTRILLALSLLALPTPAFPEEVTRRVGRLTLTLDESAAHPGGLVPVRLRSRSLGTVLAVFEGRRYPFLPSGRGLRALVPISVGARPGPATLGIEVRARSGRQRFAVPVTVQERSYPARTVILPDVKKAMLGMRAAVRDGRVVQMHLRTVTNRQEWHGPFRPPVPAEPEASFGSPQTYDAEPPVEGKTDAVWGEYHRGLDYLVPAGTPVAAPAAGQVLFAGPLLLTGDTVILDHGHGVVSVFYHLASVAAPTGDWVEAGRTLGSSGETGIAAVPHLHWGVYVHGVAVDPKLTATFE
ncbi:MAG TPA: M23 family metallopeptidase [Vicinamibacteria bacterium]|nr:M23 family metallopeptidase [Vicinamibacteria bacterium]